MKLKVNNKTVDIFYENSDCATLPVIILNTFDSEGEKVFNECQKLGCKDFILVAISNIDWNNELTPWKSPSLFKSENDYLGKADLYLSEIIDSILPKVANYIENDLHKKIDCYCLAGYSLAGLFALYSGFNTDKFKRIASASGSLWYPGFLEYVVNNELNKNVDKIYLSLGNKEKNSKNKVLASVEDNTKTIFEHLKSEVMVVYEENEGNHFIDSEKRMAKGIKEILDL